MPKAATKAASAAPKPEAAPKVSGYVQVACKIPNGLVLQLFEMVPTWEAVQGGGQRETKIARKLGDPIQVKGPAHHIDKGPGKLIVMGYAITPKVPREFWERWLAANKDADYVVNGMIWAQDDMESVRDEARDHVKAGHVSNMTPLNPEKDARAPKVLTKKGKVKDAIETSEDMKAEFFEPAEGEGEDD